MNEITKTFYDKFNKILDGREYRIGLDLGVGSIGYSIIAMDNYEGKLLPSEIITCGSRIFAASAGAVERRLKRGQRNSHRHGRERLRYLWKLLAEKGLALPLPKELGNNKITESSVYGETSAKRFPSETLKKDIYLLRFKATNEKLSLFDLGYVIYHLANHRGTASVRSFLEDSEEQQKSNTQTQKNVNDVTKMMKEKSYKTYGEYLYREKIEEKGASRERVRNSQNKTEFSITRDLILNELTLILKIQQQYYPTILNGEFNSRITGALNYETEKLIPESGTCPYFKNEPRLPSSHYLNEERRLWEALNNARLYEPVIDSAGTISGFNKIEFSKEQKDKLFEYLKTTGDLTGANTLKILGLSNIYEAQLQGRDKKEQRIKGYRLFKLEQKPFWKRLNDEQRDRFFFDWNSCPDESVLKNKLTKDYGLSGGEIDDAFSSVVLSSGYGPIGKSAAKILLEYTKAGQSYTEAIEKAIADGKFALDANGIYALLPYYGKVLPESTQKVIAKAFSQQFKNRKYKAPHTNKEELEYGRIANPVVHQALNELRKLVNEIILAFDKKPLEISLETARELKKGQQERDKMAREQSGRENERGAIFEQYIAPHLNEIKARGENPGNYILKFELAQEQAWTCPFCVSKINTNDIICSKAEIEHLFPISESQDNSKNNIVLAHSECNKDKGQKSPYEAFGHCTNGKYKWNNILSFINDKSNPVSQKAWRFAPGAFEKYLETKPMDQRFKTDNSYISKIAHKYLACLFETPNILCVKPSLTAQLRLAWGIKGLLIPFAKNLIDKNEIEAFEKEVSRDKKIRTDNRHHALDAVVIGFASRGYQNFLSGISARDYKINYNDKSWLSKILLPPMKRTADEFNNMVKRAMFTANVSFKHDHDVNGALIKDTVYKIYYSGDNSYLLTTSKGLNSITFKKNDDPKEILEKSLLKFDGRSEINSAELKKKLMYNKAKYNQVLSLLEKAREELETANAKAKDEGKKTREINVQLVYKKALEMTGGKYIHFEMKMKDKFFAVKEPSADKTGFGSSTAENLCVDLYYDKAGKLCGEIIRKINYNNQSWQPKYKKNGFNLFERIYQGDILEMDVSEDKQSLKNKSGNAPDMRTFVKVTTFTESGNVTPLYISNILKSKQGPDDSVTISSMQKYNPRKVILTSMGAIKYRSALLKNKN